MPSAGFLGLLHHLWFCPEFSHRLRRHRERRGWKAAWIQSSWLQGPSWLQGGQAPAALLSFWLVCEHGPARSALTQVFSQLSSYGQGLRLGVCVYEICSEICVLLQNSAQGSLDSAQGLRLFGCRTQFCSHRIVLGLVRERRVRGGR